MKVKITKCSSGWYRGIVGRVFEVEDDTPLFWKIKDRADAYLMKSDCEIVQTPPSGAMDMADRIFNKYLNCRSYEPEWCQGELNWLKTHIESYVQSEAISFLDTIRDHERETGNKICFDERDSGELYEIFLTQKQKK